jgi:DNA-binding MarR family transcriptional regulator
MSDGKFEAQSRSQMVETTLDLLDAVEAGEIHSQRGLATRLGVALGLTNALVKRCARKGLLKVKQVPARRYAYYLTPRGFREKSRLTAEYLSISLDFFRRARAEYAEAAEYCARRGWSRIALYGAGELSEIATLAAREAGVDLVAIIDPARNEAEFCGLPVVRAAADAAAVDAVIVTDQAAPQAAFETLAGEMPAERVVTPRLLRVTRVRAGDGANDAGKAA